MRNKLICLAGQSNGLGYGAIGLPYPGGWTPNANIQIWDGSAFVTYAPGINANGLGSAAYPTAFGAEGQFAKHLWTRNPASTVYIYKRSPIGIGLAPTALDNWSPFDTGKQFDIMCGELAAAQAAANGIPIDAFVYQGCETDALTYAQAAAVLHGLIMFMAAVRDRFNSPDMIAIIPRIHSAIASIPPGYPATPAVQMVQSLYADGSAGPNRWANAVSFPVDSFPVDASTHLNNVGVCEAGDYCHIWFSKLRP